ncbi:MAG: aldehyde ferredoxin oxidoreductase family protein, partial [Planctomycetes bacterium]|nr:aldehyde ferredoxin oxidoreductase family protein [Planctomycetota bacterium]
MNRGLGTSTRQHLVGRHAVVHARLGTAVEWSARHVRGECQAGLGSATVTTHTHRSTGMTDGYMGYMGRLLWVDLQSRQCQSEALDEGLARDFVGGYGIGARILYERLRPGTDPLGPENVLGFLTGPLTGTAAIEGNRSVVVCKSPLTGTWGDANCGGTFGPYLKFAGFDGVFFTGIADGPVYLAIEDGQAEVRDASDLWGLDTNETEHRLQERHGKGTQVAAIGPSGEKLSLIAAIMNDAGRAWARSGVGAVMGSKRLKAVVVRGSASVPVADRARADQLRKEYLRQHTGAYDLFLAYGTPGTLADASWSGDSPVKNWSGAGAVDFPTGKTAFQDELLKRTYQDKKYGCWKCTMACGGHHSVKEGGPYKGTRHHQAEYETACAFGTLLLNDSYASTLKANEICNRYGLDTISAGATIAWAVDCFGRGLLTTDDTDGIELTWGDDRAILALLEKLARREGFGDVLADGVQRAAARVGRGTEAFAIHIQGQEVPMHDPRFMPGLAIAYQLDATPARHTQGNELNAWPGIEGRPKRYDYGAKGPYIKRIGCAVHFINAAGVCVFGYLSYPISTWPDFMTAVTGHPWTLDEMLRAGERIANMRHAFNLREGLNPLAYQVPGIIVGDPPLTEGNLRGVTVDVARQNAGYLREMDWDPETAVPSRAKLEELGLAFLLDDLYAAGAGA